MPIPMDPILTEYADRAYEQACLGRNRAQPSREQVSVKILRGLEASGDAMRFVDAKGRVAWKATPSLCECLKDLEMDAREDLEDI